MNHTFQFNLFFFFFILSLSISIVSCNNDDQEDEGPYVDPRIVWSKVLGDMDYGSLILADNMIYFTANEKLLAYTTSGEFVWECILNNKLETPVLDQLGNFYIQDKSCNLYAVDINGQKKWEYNIDLPYGVGYKIPAIGPEGNIYIVGDSVYAFNENGDKLWSYFPDGYQIGSQLLISSSTPSVGADGTVYVVLHPELKLDVVALNPNGSLKWQMIFQEAYYCASSITIGFDGTLYFPGETDDGEIHYLFACSNNGSLKWRMDIPYLNRMRASVSIGEDGTLYIGTKASDQHEAVFMALDPSNGQKYWEFVAEQTHGVPDDIYVSATIGEDGLIYFSCENSIFYAMNSDGTEAWRVDFGKVNGGTPGFTCPVVDMNGIIYQTVHGTEGGIFAFKSNSKGLANTPWPKFRQNNKNTGRGISSR